MPYICIPTLAFDKIIKKERAEKILGESKAEVQIKKTDSLEKTEQEFGAYEDLCK